MPNRNASLRPALFAGAWLLAAALTSQAAAGAARLVLNGAALAPREAEAALGPALRAPRDSVSLIASLDRLTRLLQEQGYLDARPEARWRPDEAGAAGKDGVLSVQLRSGPRYRLAAIELQVSPPEDSIRFAEALALAPGGWFSPSALSRAVERAVDQVNEAGYPYARLGVSGLDWEEAGVRARLSGALGPPVTVSRVRIEGLQVTRESFAQRAAGRLVGTRYSPAAALMARDRLLQLGLFREVSFRGLEGDPDWKQGQLTYQVVEPRYNRFEGAVGVQEREAVGLIHLGLDNLAGTGRGATLRWESRGSGVQTFAARYREPMPWAGPLQAELMLDQWLEDTLYTRTRWGGHLRYGLPGGQRLEGGYEEERVVQSAGEVSQAALHTTVFGVERDLRDDRWSPRRGALVRLVGSTGSKRETLRQGGDRRWNASAVEGRLEWHRPLGRGNPVLAIDLSGAGRFSSQPVLPVFERYAVGGAASLRGHDEQRFRVDRYGLSRLEARWFLGGAQRIALFWDHALMSTREREGSPRRLRHADGNGIGLRLASPGGLVGLDYGLEPGLPPLEGKVHLQLVSWF